MEETYKGFIITPHSFRIEDAPEDGLAWSVGVFIRRESEDATSNRYICEPERSARTEEDAIAMAILLAKRLIDQELVYSLRESDPKRAEH
jgi:hypothetical protein